MAAGLAKEIAERLQLLPDQRLQVVTKEANAAVVGR